MASTSVVEESNVAEYSTVDMYIESFKLESYMKMMETCVVRYESLFYCLYTL